MMNTQFYFFMKACFLVLLTTQALALEPSQGGWNGFYVGADIGGIQSDTSMQTSVVPGGTYFNYTEDAPQLAAAGAGNVSQQNVSGGLFGGYEHQFSHILLGGEISANSLYTNDSRSVSQTFISDPNIQFVLSQSLKANWQETLRLKLGLAQKHWLEYVTGGAAMTDIKYEASYSDDNSQPGLNLPGALGSDTTSHVEFGWILGGGIEYALNNAWSIKVEYLYSDFGNVEANYPIIPTPTLSEFASSMQAKGDLIIQSLSLGLTYRF